MTALAEHVARAQMRQIALGIRQVIRRLGAAAPGCAVVAGSGAFLARNFTRERSARYSMPSIWLASIRC